MMRGSEDGFRADDFHRLCDHQGPTLTVVKTAEAHTFGGFTTVPWHTPAAGQLEKPDHDAFLFSATHQTVHRVKTSYNAAVTHRKETLAIFGNGYDLVLSDRCNENTKSTSYLGCCFELPPDI